MKTFDKAKYLNDIKELDNLNLYQYKDIDKMYGVYQNKLIEIIDRNVPHITLSKKQSKLKLKPWITSSILKSIKIKNLYYKKFLTTQKKFWYNRYKHYRNTLNSLISKSKRNNLRKYFQDNQQYSFKKCGPK